MLKRSIAFFCILIAGAGMPRASHAAVLKNPGQQPNVLFIAVDDLRPELGCYGAEGMLTPNIDRLASSGVLFERHYVQFAVCIASRVALLTSLRSERTHQIYGKSVWQKVEGAQPWGKTFKAAGYQTISLGKIWHVADNNTGDDFDVKWSPKGGDYADPKNEELKSTWKANVAKAQKAGKPYDHFYAPITECADVPDNTYADGMTADRAIEELDRVKSEGGPFMLAVGFHKPHIPFVAPRKYWDLYDESKIKLAPNPRFPKDMPPIAFSKNPNFYNYDYETYAPIPKEAQAADATARHIIHGYRAAVSFADAQVGRVLAELDRLGLADNTIVVLWGDHGFHLGDSGMWGKQSNFESATHSPLIVRAPGRSQAGTRSQALVETVDIFPTLLDYCGLKPLPVADGRSFVPLLEKPAQPWKKAAFHVFNRNGVAVIGHAIRTADYRLVDWREGWGLSGTRVALELYDYRRDPYETRNVADNPEYADVRKELEKQLREGPAKMSEK
jgi:arylsulfatase A-like enzyme